MKPSRKLAPAPIVAADPTFYPGCCRHRWFRVSPDGAPHREQCLDCGATCSRDRAGVIELYDRGVIKAPAVGASGYYRDVADELGCGQRERAA